MSELINGKQEALVSQRETLEALNREQLVDFILAKGVQVTEIEWMMNLAAQVLEGYGTSMDAELDRRQGIERGDN